MSQSIEYICDSKFFLWAEATKKQNAVKSLKGHSENTECVPLK